MLTEGTRTGSTLTTLPSSGTIAVRPVLALDSSRAPGADALLGELNGEAVAVITVRDGVIIADPFRSTPAVTERLRRSRETFLATGEHR